MALFVASVVFVLVVSALCSLTEASLYAVRLPYVRKLKESGSWAGEVLARFKRNMERPITAILIVNTAANTAGAAVAGYQATVLFGEDALIWFSIAFTLAVLFFSEILPKVLGVIHNRRIARAAANPLNVIISLLAPMVWLVQSVSHRLKPRKPVLSAPEEEIQYMAMLGAEEGSILPVEARLVKNVLGLDDVRAADIMSPRPVVFKLPANMTLRAVSTQVKEWSHSRIPLYDEKEPDTWVGLVMTRDILARLAHDEFELTLRAIAKPLYFVSEKTPGHVLLRAFLKRRTHLFGVVDKHGGIAGVVTLEDVLESVLGEEIVDEHDSAVDMQEVARLQRRRQFGEGRGQADEVAEE